MESSDIVQIMVAVISLLGVVIGVLVKRKGGGGLRIREHIRTIAICFFLAIIVADIAYLGWRHFAPTKVEITYPAEYGTVSHRETVRVLSRRVPKGCVICPVIFSHEANRYYPQDFANGVQEAGGWSCLVYVGTEGEKDVGKRFDIIAVTADRNAQGVFRAYLTDGMEGGWTGLERLPEGTMIRDRFTVTRR